VPETTPIGLVQLTSNLVAYQYAGCGADNGCHRSVAIISDFCPYNPSYHAAQDRGNGLVVAMSRENAVIVIPTLTQIADVWAIMLGTPSVSRRMRRRIRKRGSRPR
jgi:hypothetical protein